jgi:hypothetical protein
MRSGLDGNAPWADADVMMAGTARTPAPAAIRRRRVDFTLFPPSALFVVLA